METTASVSTGGNPEFQKAVTEFTDNLRDLLIEKNRMYGNSALQPLRLFSNSDTIEAINVRIDDKLSRIKNLQEDDIEDSVTDLCGYLILRQVFKKLK